MNLISRKPWPSLAAALGVMAGALSAQADYSSTVQSMGPVMYYRLNETTPVPNDVATNLGTLGAAANGLYLNGASHPTPGALTGREDSAANFPDAAGNRVRIPWAAPLAMSAPFTVEFWASPAALASTDSATMCPIAFTQFGDPPGNGGFRNGWLFYQNGATGWTFRMYGTGSTGYNATLNQAVSVGQWYHVVGVYDGANIYLYVNGQLGATVAAPLPFAPVVSPAIPLSIGARADGQLGYFRYFGNVDEVAYYTNVLSAAEVLAHYQNGTSSSPTTAYEQLVLAKQPAAYYRLNETYYSDPGTRPTAVNTGGLAAAANAEYGLGVINGVPGVSFSGFGANNYAAQFNAQAGSIAIPAQSLSTDTITLTCWLKRRGYQTLGGIVMQRDAATTGTATGLQIWDASNNDLRGNWNDANYNLVTGLVPPDNTWTFAAMVVTPTNTVIYMDDVAVSLAAVNGSALTHAAHDFSIAPILIGEDSYGGRFFNGEIDEVAVFAGALTAEQLKQLFYSGNVPPIILTQPTAPAGTVTAGAPVTLAALVSGTPALGYQWMKDGVIMAGQTTPALAFSNITTNDTGNYSLVITNAYGAATSSVVALNVVFPAEPATLLSAIGFPAYNANTGVATLTQVILAFSGPLAQEAGDSSHYSIPGLTVTGARFTNLNSTVVLTTSAQTQGANYTVTVTGVTDGIGSPLVNNTAQFQAWVSSPANGILFEYYYYNQDTAVSALLADPLYPDHPALRTNLWVFDSRALFPDDTKEQYGSRMSGVFVPPTSGNWRFYLRSDDSSQLYFNPTGTDPAGVQLLIDETACCGEWNKYQSAAFPLVAGQAYYLELLYKEGGGGDYGKVAARLESDGAPAIGVANAVIDPASLRGPSIGYPFAPADVGGPLGVVGPTNVSVPANHPVLFTAEVTNPSGLPVFYQWLRNGSAIADATGSGYSFVPTSTDNGARYSVRVSKIGSVVTTTDAVLTVTANTDAPAVTSVRGSENLNRFVVSFSELMGTPSTANFTITGYTTTAVELDSTGTNVIVTLDKPLAPGTAYSLSVQGIQDAVGTTLTTATTPLNTFVFSRGLLRFEYFGKLSYSDNLIYSTLLSDPRYPKSPDWTGFLTSFDSRTVFPDDQRNGYGARVTGLFVPKTNGNYSFYMKSDDTSLLFLNPLGTEPIDATTGSPLLNGETCCHPFADLTAIAGPFVAGQMYYIEADYKEGGGGDYVQVAAKPEADPTLPNSLLPLAGPLLGVLADPAGASVTITQQPADTTVAFLGANDTPTMLLDATFNSNNGNFTKVDYGTPIGPWSYDSVAGSWTNHGQPDGGCDGIYASGLNSPAITMTNSGGVELVFKHRYSFEGYTETDGTPWDGGQVRLSVNGGPFATVPAANFTTNGYQTAIGGNIIAAVTSTPGWINIAFAGESTNYSTRQMLTSACSLGYFNAGDTIVVQFLASWDDCTEAQEPNWEIDSVQLKVGAAVPALATLSVAAESTYKYEPNPFIAYIWQQNKGAGFVDMLDVSGPTNNLTLTLQDSGAKYRCLVYGPGASATSAVATVTVTLPLSIQKTAADTLTLVWPLPTPPMTYTSFLLEQTPSLSSAAWTTVPTSSYQATSAKVRVIVTPTGTGMYYRLRLNQ